MSLLFFRSWTVQIPPHPHVWPSVNINIAHLLPGSWTWYHHSFAAWDIELNTRREIPYLNAPSYYSLSRLRIGDLFNNYSPKAKWILSNNARDEVEGIIRQYSLSLRRIIVLVLFQSWTTENNGLKHKTKTQLFVCTQVYIRRVLIIRLHVHWLWFTHRLQQ